MLKNLIAVFFITILVCSCQSISPSNSLLLVTVADQPSAQHWHRGYPSGGYMAISSQADAKLAELEQRYPIERVDGWPIKALGVYCSVMALKSGADVQTTLIQLSNEKRVKLAQPMQTFTVMGEESPPRDNNYFSLQYGNHADQVRQWHQHTTGEGVKIAVIDTGIDRNHPDLKSSIKETKNFVGDATFDSDIHGTAVAGIIASGFSSTGAVGLAPGAQLFAYKACWPQQKDAIVAHCNSFTLAKAIAAAIDQRVDIINLSLAGPKDPLLSELLNAAMQSGTLIIAAEHNESDFPAVLSGVIAVTNGFSHGNLAWATSNDPPHAEAQATELLSTSPGGHYDFFSGSSMATARISGLTALIKQNSQTLSSDQAMKGINKLITSLNVAQIDARTP